MIPLLLSWALSIGQVQTNYLTQEYFANGGSIESSWQTPNTSFDVVVSAKALMFGHVEFSGSIDSIQSFAGVQEGFVPSFSPSYIRYDIGIAGVIGPLRVGFEHWCGHSVIADPLNLPSELVAAGSTRFYLEVSGQANLGKN